MRNLMIALLTCGGMAILSVPSFAQSSESSIAARQQQPETFCYDAAGPAYCAPTSEHRYEACADLAVERGERLGSRGFDRFVYECLTGTIGRAPN
jgi:hypothetical protein